jgi:hypothetical protein
VEGVGQHGPGVWLVSAASKIVVPGEIFNFDPPFVYSRLNLLT